MFPCGAAHFLELSFGVHELAVRGQPMHTGWVRYFGVGRMVACFHTEPIAPNAIALPPPGIGLSVVLQRAWLQQELQELAEVRSPRSMRPLSGTAQRCVIPTGQRLCQGLPALN
jgi:hypothetical protein